MKETLTAHADGLKVGDVAKRKRRCGGGHRSARSGSNRLGEFFDLFGRCLRHKPLVKRPAKQRVEQRLLDDDEGTLTVDGEGQEGTPWPIWAERICTTDRFSELLSTLHLIAPTVTFCRSSERGSRFCKDHAHSGKAEVRRSLLRQTNSFMIQPAWATSAHVITKRNVTAGRYRDRY